MRWLRARERRERDDRGAVAVWVAMSIIPFLVFVAVVADVGLLFWEKGQLQNGADAAALAVAQECAADPTCSGGAGTLADEMAALNANDDSAASELLSLTVNTSSGKVEVRASTSTGSGTTVRHPFASIIVPTETTVDADATAEWGAPIAGTTIPLAIAQCEFDDLPAQPADTQNPQRSLILINNGNTGEPCANGYPGGFGWLDGTNCQAEISAGGTVGGAPGIQPTESKTGCSNAYLNTLLCQTVLIPLYSATTAQGQNATYTISRFAAFKITGLKTSGNNDVYCGGSPLSPQFSTGNAKGIQGFFVKYVELGEDFELGNSPGAGLMIVRLSE